MNRRDFLKSVPAVSVTSVLLGEVDLRKLYLEHMLPPEYSVEKVEFSNGREGVEHYKVIDDSSVENILYFYLWDSIQREHYYRMKLYDDSSFHTYISGEVDSIEGIVEEFRKHFVYQVFHEKKYNIIESEVGGVTYHTASDTTYDEKVIEYSYDPHNDRHCYRFHDFTSESVHTELGYADSALEAKQILQHKE